MASNVSAPSATLHELKRIADRLGLCISANQTMHTWDLRFLGLDSENMPDANGRQETADRYGAEMGRAYIQIAFRRYDALLWTEGDVATEDVGKTARERLEAELSPLYARVPKALRERPVDPKKLGKMLVLPDAPRDFDNAPKDLSAELRIGSIVDDPAKAAAALAAGNAVVVTATQDDLKLL